MVDRLHPFLLSALLSLPAALAEEMSPLGIKVDEGLPIRLARSDLACSADIEAYPLDNSAQFCYTKDRVESTSRDTSRRITLAPSQATLIMIVSREQG